MDITLSFNSLVFIFFLLTIYHFKTNFPTTDKVILCTIGNALPELQKDDFSELEMVYDVQ